jgi:hypothetical protein
VNEFFLKVLLLLVAAISMNATKCNHRELVAATSQSLNLGSLEHSLICAAPASDMWRIKSTGEADDDS